MGLKKKKYLKKPEIDKFEKQLMDMRAQIVRALKGTAKEVKTPDEATGYPQHQADGGTDDQDRTIQVELTSKEYARLHEIERALEKIKEGSYGICDILPGQEISKKRLEAVPYATRSLQGQALFEQGVIS